MYTYKIEQAIKAAALLHSEQLRKGDIPLPYITHLVAVTIILRDYTKDEDTLVAALLHDTLEDTDYTAEEMTKDFGKKVTTIVNALTEPTYERKTKLNWIEKKKAYAEQLRKGPIEAVYVAAADKCHNFRSIVDDYYQNHNSFLRDFGSDLEGRMEAYQTISNAINNRLKDGIVHEFNHTFESYKNFILDVKKTISQ